MQDNKSKETHTTPVIVINVPIKANNLDGILNVIRQEFKKYPHLNSFQGCFSGLLKGEPIVSFEEELETPSGDFQ